MKPTNKPSKKAKDEAKKTKRPAWAPGFLAVFATDGVVAKAARASNIDRTTVYALRQRDLEFAEEMDAAYLDSSDWLKAEAIARGRDGWEEPVIYQGQLCMSFFDEAGNPFTPLPGERLPQGIKVVPLTIRKKSDMLLKFLIEHRDNQAKRVELSGPDGKPIESKIDDPHQISSAAAADINERLKELAEALEEGARLTATEYGLPEDDPEEAAE